MSFEELLRYILTDLGREVPRNATKWDMLTELTAELLEVLGQGGNVVVLIDEVQNTTIPVLEELRLLSNLETEKEKILQFVLAGQPEFEVMIGRPEIRQLRERIAMRARLRPLKRSEIKPYIDARLAAAGGEVKDLFSPMALFRLWLFSRGVPRLVNVACDNALVSAFAANRKRIGWRDMGQVLRDLRTEGAARGIDAISERAMRVAVAAAMGVALGVGVTRLAGF
jgi:general secretion pathway protein A